MHRYQIRAFKGGSPADFRAALEMAAHNLGANIIWDVPGDGATLLRTSDTGDLHTVYLSEQSPLTKVFYTEIGKVSGLPWIHLSIPGAPLWCYTLYEGDEQKDAFNPCPELWDDSSNIDDERQEASIHPWSGNPQILSDLWRIPVQSIERYLIRWGLEKTDQGFESTGGYRYKLRGKAYPEDKYEYGCGEQRVDFWRVLGFSDIQETKHTFVRIS